MRGMPCPRTNWIVMVMISAMLASGCALFRRQPAMELVPPTQPLNTESPQPQGPEDRLVASHHGLLTRAAMAISVGLEAGGDALLEEFLRSAAAPGPEARSRALALRAVLVLHEGGERGARMAKSYLQAARQANPGGVNAGGIALALDLLAALEKESAALARSRVELGAGREREKQQADTAAALRVEVESLELQLEELKAIHLQIESGKEDTPSR